MKTDWRAMQSAGSFGAKNKQQPPAPGGVKAKYLSMGSWHASLKKEGVRVKRIYNAP